MEKFEFVETEPDELRLDYQAISWLEEAAANFGGMTSIENLLFLAKQDMAALVRVYDKKAIKLRGTFVVVFSQQEVGRVMSLFLLGGEDINEWKDELRGFLYNLAKEENIDQFFYMGRKGFVRLFPELEECARVYRLILKSDHKKLN